MQWIQEHHEIKRVTSLVPRLFVGGEGKSLVSTVRACVIIPCWTHVQAIVGGECVILIHVIYSVTYNHNLASTSIVTCWKRETTTLQRIAIFENFVEIVSRICCTHTLHAACQKFSLKYFRVRLKIREIHEIKDPRKFSAIWYTTSVTPP